MAEIDDLVLQESDTEGTGDFNLVNLEGWRTFNEAFGTGGTDKFEYAIRNRDADEWEIGTAHLSDSTTLVRDTVDKSSNSNNKVDFSAGTKSVVNDEPASQSKAANIYSETGVDLSTDPTVTHNLGEENIQVQFWDQSVSPEKQFIPSTVEKNSGDTTNKLDLSGSKTNVRVVVMG